MKTLLRSLRNLAATALLIWSTIGVIFVVPYCNHWAELVLALAILTIGGYFAGRTLTGWIPRALKGGTR